jgi:magnesium-transporting ATPase (P-type)
MADAELAAAVLETDVFARTSPEDKLRLVMALQAHRLTVAMTGDGVNDAPALKRADAGIAMGRKGSEAAKEAAEIVLADDNFASIVAAVAEGRTVYDNVMKVIAWTLPTNGGAGLTIVAALAAGFALPMTPVQILWINTVTAVALGLTFAFEPMEPGAMQRPPRPAHQPILTLDLLWRIGFVSVAFLAGTFGVFFWTQSVGGSLETARTMVVNTLVVMEIAYLFSVRYVHGTSLTWAGVLGTKAVLIGVGSVVLAQLAFTYLPICHTLFGSRSLSVFEAAVVIGIGVVLLLVVEIEKQVRLAIVGRHSARSMKDL